MTREERIEQAKEFWLLNDGSTFEVMVDFAEMVSAKDCADMMDADDHVEDASG